MRLQANIQSIREYALQYKELTEARQFLYNTRLADDNSDVAFVLMVVNPRENSYGSRKLFGDSKFFLDTTSVAMTACFFWSSRNVNDFRSRYGPLTRSPHVQFCTRLNKELISTYGPKAVIFTGISHAKWIANIYELQLVRSITENKVRLIEHYSDGKRPWIFTKHWSGSFGFSNSQRERTKSYIASALDENPDANNK
jgi:hypothetical protein